MLYQLIIYLISTDYLIHFIFLTKGDEITCLDLVSLLVNSNTSNCESQSSDSTDSNREKCSNANRKRYFKGSKEIKLDKENLLYSTNNKPILVDESYTFDLNANTNYLNLFLWTIQYLNKGTKKKNLLLGYVRKKRTSNI